MKYMLVSSSVFCIIKILFFSKQMFEEQSFIFRMSLYLIHDIYKFYYMWIINGFIYFFVWK